MMQLKVALLDNKADEDKDVILDLGREFHRGAKLVESIIRA